MRNAFRAVVFALAVGCGRVGFDSTAPNDVPELGEPGGRLDPSFGTGGQVIAGLGGTEHAEDVVAMQDGSYVIAGYRRVSASAATFEVFALTADGAVDLSYGTDGYSLPSWNGFDYGFGLVARPDGTMLVTGDGRFGSDDMVITVLDARGAVVPGFGTAGFRAVNSPASGNDTSRRAVQAGMTTYICGAIRYDQANSELAVLALDPQGQGVPSFDTDGVVLEPVSPLNNDCSDLLVDRAGKIVVAGRTDDAMMVGRYNVTGVRDQTFAGTGFLKIGTSGSALGIALAPSDDLFVAGSEGSHGLLVRVAPSGAPQVFPATGGPVVVANTPLTDVLIQADGKIVVAGERVNGTETDIVIMRYTSDGTPDPTFGTAGELVIDVSANDRIRALRQGPDGKLVAVGYVATTNGERPWIARIQ